MRHTEAFALIGNSLRENPALISGTSSLAAVRWWPRASGRATKGRRTMVTLRRTDDSQVELRHDTPFRLLL